MAIINQNLDPSQKKETRTLNLGATATGVTTLLEIVPYNSIIQGVNFAVFGISGAPTYTLSLLRFAGGQTSIAIGATLAVLNYGTSGALGMSLAAPGVTVLQGDVLLLTSGGANSAITTGTVTVVTSGLDDIKVWQNTVP